MSNLYFRRVYIDIQTYRSDAKYAARIPNTMPYVVSLVDDSILEQESPVPAEFGLPEAPNTVHTCALIGQLWKYADSIDARAVLYRLIMREEDVQGCRFAGPQFKHLTTYEPDMFLPLRADAEEWWRGHVDNYMWDLILYGAEQDMIKSGIPRQVPLRYKGKTYQEMTIEERISFQQDAEKLVFHQGPEQELMSAAYQEQQAKLKEEIAAAENDKALRKKLIKRAGRDANKPFKKLVNLWKNE